MSCGTNNLIFTVPMVTDFIQYCFSNKKNVRRYVKECETGQGSGKYGIAIFIYFMILFGRKVEIEV